MCILEYVFFVTNVRMSQLFLCSNLSLTLFEIRRLISLLDVFVRQEAVRSKLKDIIKSLEIVMQLQPMKM